MALCNEARLLNIWLLAVSPGVFGYIAKYIWIESLLALARIHWLYSCKMNSARGIWLYSQKLSNMNIARGTSVLVMPLQREDLRHWQSP